MNNTYELKLRLFTAILLIILALGAVFYLPFIGFSGVSAAIMVFSGWEWIQLSGYSDKRSQGFFLIMLSLGLLGTCYLPLFGIVCLSAGMGLCLVGYIIGLVIADTLPKRVRAWTAGLGGMSLILCWQSLLILKRTPEYLGLGLLIVGLADTLAYFSGRVFGKHSLAPLISPNKTWEGFLAALLGPVFILSVALRYCPIFPSTNSALLISIGLTAGVSIAGDLFESLVKRQQKVKDSGLLLPGHGGLLDRIDGLIPAIPVFTASLYGLHILS